MKNFTLSTLLVISYVYLAPIVSVIENVYAQEVKATTTVSMVVADINLTDVLVKVENGKFTGSFALQGKMGKQNDVVYGIVVTNPKGTLLDSLILGEVASVQEGEIVRKSFLYTIPTYVQGKDVSVKLIAETKGGLMLGSNTLATKDFIGKTSNLICSIKDSKDIACTSKVDTTLTVSYHTKTSFGTVATSSSQEVKKNVSTVFTPKLSPGRYYVAITNKENTESVYLPLLVKGSFGSIINTVVTESSTGTLSVITTVNSSPSFGSKVKVTLLNGTASCGEGEADASNQFADIKIATSCKKGVATITLLNKEGSVLATSTSPFNTALYVAPVAQKQTTSRGAMNYVYGVIALLLAVSAVIIYRMRISKKVVTVISGLVIAFVYAGVPKTHALSMFTTTLGPPGCGPCEIAHTCAYSVSSDKSSYLSSDTMKLTADANSSYDFGANPGDQASCGISYSPAGSSASFDDPANFGTAPDIVGFSFTAVPNSKTSSVNLALNSGLGAGSHYVRLRGVTDSHFVSPSKYIYGSAPGGIKYSNFTFMVAAATPTVHIQFSFLDKVKSFVSDTLVNTVFAGGR